MINDNIFKITYREDLEKYQLKVIVGHETITLFYKELKSCWHVIKYIYKGLRGE